MTDPALLRRAIESVGIEKPSDYTLVLEEVERLMDEQTDNFVNYSIPVPGAGWRKEFSEDEKTKLRPIAETLAMLDGNAFFTHQSGDGEEWYEQYLGEAAAVYDANGGDNGWAGEASFKRISALIRAATEFVKEAEEGGFGKTSEKALPGSWDALIVALNEVKK